MSCILPAVGGSSLGRRAFTARVKSLAIPKSGRKSFKTVASKNDDISVEEEVPKKKGNMNDYVEPDASISGEGLIQLIKMGLGAVSSDIKEINLDDPERTVVMELEANNFENADGKPLWNPDDQGYVDENAPPNAGILNVAVPVVLGVGATGLVIATLSAL